MPAIPERDAYAERVIRNDLATGPDSVIFAAARLLTEPDDRPNPEYDRALVDLTVDLLFLSTAYHDRVGQAMKTAAGHPFYGTEES